MDAFIRKYQPFVVSVVFLLTALAALLYSVLISPATVARSDAAIIADIIRKDNQVLAVIQAKMAEDRQTGAEQVIHSLPAFLKRINAIAHQTNVIVNELIPSKDRNIKFTIKITTDFYTFLKFIMRLESLDVAINDLQIHPYDNTKKTPVHAIEFTITPRHDAKELESSRIAALREAAEAPDRRNPFQRFTYINKVVTTEIDLTWIYKLSGIGRIGEEQVATVDNKDIRKGDQLENMTVTAVLNDRVQLERKTEHGTDRYVLRFRSSGLKKP